MTSGDIQKLRETTGAGVMECKKALEEAKGNFEQAIKIIHERGLAKADTKQSRTTGAGLITSYVHNGRIGVLLDLRAETDFVVRSAPFQKLAQELAMHIAAMNPDTVDALLAQPYVRDESTVIGDFIKTTVAQVGENIRVERFSRYEI